MKRFWNVERVEAGRARRRATARAVVGRVVVLNGVRPES